MKMETVKFQKKLLGFFLLFSLTARAQELPSGTIIEARLSTAVGSSISHRGDPIIATVIAPVTIAGRIAISQGANLEGSVEAVEPVGLGLKRLTATITFHFDTLQSAMGQTIPLTARVFQIETAKERVDYTGVVHGIHPTVNLSSSIQFYTFPFLYAAPGLGACFWGVKELVARAPNSEIYFPAGTEFLLRLTSPATFRAPLSEPAHIPSVAAAELAPLQNTINDSATQRCKVGKRTSDLVNIVFLGSRDQIARAFQASGWYGAERHSVMALYRMYFSLSQRMGYRRAPMDCLRLNGRLADATYQKSLDTFTQRHHLRLWQNPQSDGRVWLSSATEDVSIHFHKGHWTHLIDPYIDNERAKVVNDLSFTGCVDAASVVPRNLSPYEGATADLPLRTDGNLVVLRLNDCRTPRRMIVSDEYAGSFGRGLCMRTLVSIRNDLFKSNILFTTYATVRLLASQHEPRESKSPVTAGSNWRTLDWLNDKTPLLTAQAR